MRLTEKKLRRIIRSVIRENAETNNVNDIYNMIEAELDKCDACLPEDVVSGLSSSAAGFRNSSQLLNVIRGLCTSGRMSDYDSSANADMLFAELDKQGVQYDLDKFEPGSEYNSEVDHGFNDFDDELSAYSPSDFDDDDMF
jgi:hypothetical protein